MLILCKTHPWRSNDKEDLLIVSSTGTTCKMGDSAQFALYVRAPESITRRCKKPVDSADDAFGKWSSIRAPQRAKILFRAARMLEERNEDACKQYTVR